VAHALTIVGYAVNGTGAGHVTRLVAIGRALRRVAKEHNCNLEIYLVTTSEAGKIAYRENFPTLKFPCLSIAAECGLAPDQHWARGRRWVRQVLELLEPDLIMVDSFPSGAFDELPELLSKIRRKVFVYRPSKPSYVEKNRLIDKMLDYDLILVPESQTELGITFPESLASKMRFLGPVIIREHTELASRDSARAKLGASPDQKVIYLTFGGGGDQHAEKNILACLASLSTTDHLLVVGAGPLYRGHAQYGRNIVWIDDVGSYDLLLGFDAAISAAGYNSFYELMYFGIPTILVPQERLADDQFARAERAAQKHAAIVMRSGDSLDFTSQVVRVLGQETAVALRKAAQQMVPRNYAQDFALEILQLLTPKSEIP
jgi:UDP-N-acetylglucosamine--N-acetylmuramyl-(pentapeptide) pyrophosphoryl-undecaprenol N-acetylglucosamine transferase